MHLYRQVLIFSLLLASFGAATASLPVAIFAEGNSLVEIAKKKKPACSDRRDNDHDGLIDYPRDPGCKNKRDNNERNKKVVSGGVEVGGSLLGVQFFPSDNAWNTDISSQPVDPNSDTLISSIGLNGHLHPDFGTFWEGSPIGFPYVSVPGSYAKSSVEFDYSDESDVGPYPIPDDVPIEGGASSDGDRHVLIVDRDNLVLYELYYVHRMASGKWTAGSGAIFNLRSNDLRPAGWTSADAAGLPILPGLVRFDEVMQKGEISHALRFTAQRTRRAYVAPARHYASSSSDPSLPPMGMRVRLKSDYNISTFAAPVQVILLALKKYGMILADNGSNWFISGAHDARWNDEVLSEIKSVPGSAFEVVQMGEVTGAGGTK